MGYNLTRHVIRRNRPQLDQLYTLKETIRFHSTTPSRLAYKLREAIAACGEFKELSEYHRILSYYTIRQEASSVLAEYNDSPIGIPTREMVVEEVKPLPAQPTKRSVIGALGLVDVLSELIGNGEKEEISFPSVVLSLKDKRSLLDWTRVNDWTYIDHEEQGITVTSLTVDPSIAWSPEDED